MPTVHVNLPDRSYDIAIGSGMLSEISERFTRWAPSQHYTIITDENVDELHGHRAAELLGDSGSEVQVFTVPAGETSKSPDMLFDLWESLLAEGTDRSSVVIAVGGGVVGDLAGFLAASYTRGIRFLQVPTTLLAQVDSSVGGKVGINLSDAKNMVGAFWQPHGVLIDVDVLATLPPREYSAGLAEVIKYGVIMDAEFFGWLEAERDAIKQQDSATLTTIIQRSCQLKAEVVEADEREVSGRRAILNFGHTFGHALEAATSYGSVLHGEAVAIGMVAAAKLAERTGKLANPISERLIKLLEEFDLPTKLPEAVDPDDILRLMWHDKKVADNELVFVLPTALGNVELLRGFTDAEIVAAMAS